MKTLKFIFNIFQIILTLMWTVGMFVLTWHLIAPQDYLWLSVDRLYGLVVNLFVFLIVVIIITIQGAETSED